MTEESREQSPQEKVAADIRELYSDRNHNVSYAVKAFGCSGIMGGLAVWSALEGDSFMAGVAAGVATYGVGIGTSELNLARNSSQEATGLRQALTQHDLDNGVVTPIYEPEREPEEQAESPEGHLRAAES